MCNITDNWLLATPINLVMYVPSYNSLLGSTSHTYFYHEARLARNIVNDLIILNNFMVFIV